MSAHCISFKNNISPKLYKALCGSVKLSIHSVEVGFIRRNVFYSEKVVTNEVKYLIHNLEAPFMGLHPPQPD